MVVGAACAAIAARVPSPLGWVVGVSASAVLGGLGVAPVSRRLLDQATARLAALAAEADDDDQGSDRAVGNRSAPTSEFAAFDVWVDHLRDLIAHLRDASAEFSSMRGLTGRLAEAMNESGGSMDRSESNGEATAQPLQLFLDRFRRAAARIENDLSALNAANERVASGAHDQSEAVSRTATSVEALSDRIDRVSRNSNEAAEACERAREEARQGLEQIQEVIEGMDRLLARIEANGRKVRRLEDRSTEIRVIVDLIRGISSRTDMLALNATIESIRAGEHGRGFAIVAEEIRKLAERAAAATREIGALVEAIQADAQESIRGLGEEQTETQRESQRIRETGSSLARISQVVTKSAQLVEGISRSTHDQVLSTQDLVRAMQRVSDATQQTQESAARSREFIKALNGSCLPWRRLAALEPAAARANSAFLPPPAIARVVVPSGVSSESSRTRRDPARERLVSESSR